jgi:hypothetical protein
MQNRRFRVALGVFVFCASAVLFGQAKKTASMTNADVTKLVQSGLSVQVIQSAIATSQQVAFDLTPDGLVTLKKAGVPDAVITAMQSRQNRTESLSSSTQAASAPATKPRGTLSRETARQIIDSQSAFREPFRTTITVGRKCLDESSADYFSRMQSEYLNPELHGEMERQRHAADVVTKLGLVVRTTAVARPRECRIAGAKLEQTALTSTGQAHSVHWRRVENGYDVALSQRKLLDVTGIRSGDGAALVEFTWRWVPLEGRDQGSRTFGGQAEFNLYDDGWRLDQGKFRYNFFDPMGGMMGDDSMFGGRVADESSAPGATPSIEAAPSTTAIIAKPTIVEGRRLFNSGEYADAARVGIEILAHEPNSGDAHKLVGEADYRVGNYAEALSHLRDAIEAGQAVELPVKHHRTSFGLMPSDSLDEGSLTIAKQSLSFQSVARRQDDFESSGIAQVDRVRAFPGRVAVRVIIEREGKQERRLYNFYSPQAGLRAKEPGKAVSPMVVVCEECESSAQGLVELLRPLLRQTDK